MARMKIRWLRFSLRTLLVLVTALCIWLGIQVNAARRQREAVAAIQKAGGTVYYDYQIVFETSVQWPIKSFNDSIPPPGPAWLRRQIGDDYFRTVAAVCFLDLPAVDKADLDRLAELRGLKALLSSGTAIVDKDLTVLASLHELEALVLIHTPVNGSILASLPNPRCLNSLWLIETDVDDAAIESIEKMTGLVHLRLTSSRITDAGLEHLRNLKKLEYLYLGETRITDAGLQQLAGLKQLKLVSLDGAQVSSDGVSALRAALPNANIYWP